MKFSHGVGFFALGAMMLALPQVAPGLCPRNGFDGTSGRELWLQIMGCLQTGLGLTGLLKASVLLASEWLASWGELIAGPSEVEAAEGALDWASVQADRGPQVVAVDFSSAPVWAEREAA